MGDVGTTLPDTDESCTVVSIAACAGAGSGVVGKVFLRRPVGLCLRLSFRAGLGLIDLGLPCCLHEGSRERYRYGYLCEVGASAIASAARLVEAVLEREVDHVRLCLGSPGILAESDALRGSGSPEKSVFQAFWMNGMGQRWNRSQQSSRDGVRSDRHPIRGCKGRSTTQAGT
jgi:hypothetical protein